MKSKESFGRELSLDEVKHVSGGSWGLVVLVAMLAKALQKNDKKNKRD